MDLFYYEEEEYSLLSSQQDYKQDKLRQLTQMDRAEPHRLLRFCTMLFLLLKGSQLCLSTYSLCHSSECQWNSVVQHTLDSHSSPNLTLFLTSNLALLLFFYHYFKTMRQFFSVPELAKYRSLLSLSQGLSLVYLNIDLYRQLFVFFDYSLHIQSRLNITRHEMVHLLLLFNLCLAMMIHSLNYVLICASNK